MSDEEVLPSDLVPIKDVNDQPVHIIGRFAVEEHNRKGGHHFIYERVVNGLCSVDNFELFKCYIVVIEAKNDDGFHWSYIAKVRRMNSLPPKLYLSSFEEVIKFSVPN